MVPHRVLLTTDTVGGVWTYAIELARALEPHGVAIDLATMGGPLSPAQRAETMSLPHVTVHVSHCRLEWMERPWDDVARAGEWLLHLERALRPDVVHLNQYAFGALPVAAPALLVGHSCVLSWWRAVHGTRAPRTWRRYRDVVTAGLHGADLVVAPTAAMLAALRLHYGPIPRACVVPNGRAAGRFPPAERREEFVLTAGRLWDEAKNVALLDRIADRLSWPVLVAGEDQHPDGGRIGLTAARSLGRIAPDELAGWLGRAGLFVLPARYEPFGLAVLEAALAGCPLVLGDIPSLRELWDGVAVFVPPDDEDAVTAAVESLIRDAPLRATLAMRARRRALRFTPARMAAAYLAAYAALPGRPSRKEASACAS